ncbi:MAG: hypothetical protein DDG59_09765 [Anaerolineae bacterium]|jgi:hypothetical protein|nr:MAG: hypothetical protein DDG59_09765 [Anaerolineae bacterium]
MRKDFVSLDQPNQLAQRVQALRHQLSAWDPQQLATNTATSLIRDHSGEGYFQFLYWQEATLLNIPSFSAISANTKKELGIAHQALILYYFITARPHPLTEKWISFAELPDGRFYTQAFQGYTGGVIRRHFENQLDKLEEAVKKLNGVAYSFADRAYLFWVLPRVPLLLVYWQGDEDFPPNYQILFDACVASYLPTDACAIAGSMLTKRLIAASPL